jgi:PEP-CTERM motif
VPDPENGNVQVPIVRKRRSRRHRRNRLVRRWLAAVLLAVFTVGCSALALMYFSPSLFQAERPIPTTSRLSELNTRAATVNQILSQAQPSRPVYPYSVVPGGVEDVNELRWVAEHDPIVGAHYAGFNYARAQVVRLTLARTVYLSYRIGNHIYWTSRRIKLKKGEKLITDGRITARTRCANRVEQAPQQQEANATEPTPEKFDEPLGIGEGTAMQAPPTSFQSALLNRPQIPGLEPSDPLTAYSPFNGGNLIPISPPPLPDGLCGPAKKKKGSTGVEGEGSNNGKKKKSGPCGSAGSPGNVPEPGTWLLFASGIAAIIWQARRRLSQA